MFSQQEHMNSLYHWYDAVTDSNYSELYKGVQYIKDYNPLTLAEYPFYKTDIPFKGNIVYQGQPFYDQIFRYDIEKQCLIIQPQKKSIVSVLQLVSGKVQEFTIDQKKFVGLEILPRVEGLGKGFYQVLAQKKQRTMLKRNRKIKREALLGGKNSNIYHRFIERNLFVLKEGDTCFLINGKQSLVTKYPEKKNAIKKFYKNYSSLRKTDIDHFYTKLFTELFTR